MGNLTHFEFSSRKHAAPAICIRNSRIRRQPWQGLVGIGLPSTAFIRPFAIQSKPDTHLRRRITIFIGDARFFVKESYDCCVCPKD
jgi:hypothetical protein